MNSTLANLENYGIREIMKASELMKAYANGEAPTWFGDRNVTVEFNTNSGNVFLTNEDYEVLMINDDGELCGWYFLGYHGNEGDAKTLWIEFQNGDVKAEDYEELAYILRQEGMDEEAEELEKMLFY